MLRDRLRMADWLLIIGSSILLVSLFLSWYQLSFSYSSGTTVVHKTVAVSGWEETKLSLLVIIFALVAISIVLLSRSRPLMLPLNLPYRIVLLAVSLGAFVIVLTKIFVHETDLSVSYGIFLSLAATVLMVFGSAALYRQRGSEKAQAGQEVLTAQSEEPWRN